MENIIVPVIFFLIVLFALADTSTDESFDKSKLIMYGLILLFGIFAVKAILKSNPVDFKEENVKPMMTSNQTTLQ